MILPSIAENPENVIFTLGVFTKILFFMQCADTSDISKTVERDLLFLLI